jgi:hypothetical protein
MSFAQAIDLVGSENPRPNQWGLGDAVVAKQEEGSMRRIKIRKRMRIKSKRTSMSKTGCWPAR